MQSERPTTTCPECDGCGEVPANQKWPIRRRHPEWVPEDDEMECPTCCGEGEVDVDEEKGS
jgi:RecJ-like exonuclease